MSTVETNEDAGARSIDALESPALIVGCGRSGTTWLQALVAQHSAVASSPETEVFAAYLSLLEKRWHRDAVRQLTHGVRIGLHQILSPDEFYQAMRPLAYAVLANVLRRKPGATVVLEKTPHNVLYVPLILKLFPKARFIHLIRDPRAVVASLRAAAAGWGSYWAESGALAGATRWRGHVSAGLAIPEATDNYFELRYEELQADGVHQLQRLFDWLKLEVDLDKCRQYIEASQIERLRDSTDTQSVSPTVKTEEFFRSGTSAGWHDELSRVDVAAIEYVAKDLMLKLGYEMASSTGWRNRLIAHPLASCLAGVRVSITTLNRGVSVASRWLAKRL